jgi:UDP-hydrolysing UDP-N-acetyl-D-glucosamine 2-epimerase
MAMNTTRKICVFTGSRAEYGLMRGLLKKLSSEPKCTLQLIVSGSHLFLNRGFTKKEIEADGLTPSFEIPLQDHLSMAEQAATVIQQCSEAFSSLSPDLLIVLGDRYETFAAASSAYLNKVPIAHLHGGEETRGAIDDGLRHAITHLATWHFTSAYPYLETVRRLGADPEHSFCVGPMVLDALKEEAPISRDEFEHLTDYKFASTNILVGYHSATKSDCLGVSGFKALLQVLEEKLSSDKALHILFTYPNLDIGGNEIIALMHDFVDLHPESCWIIASLGHSLYLAALRLFSALVGNSSSGVIEAPLVGLPVLNIGNRQEGRLRFGSVIDADADPESIRSKIDLVLSSQRQASERQGFSPDLDNIFPGGPCPSDVIADKLLAHDAPRISTDE